MPEQSKLISHFYVKLDGADASDELMRAIREITVENSLHMPDVATLVIHDPKLRWVDDPLMALGKAVEISARGSAPNDQGASIFDGEVVEIEPDFGPATHHLIIRCFDRLHRLGRGRKARSFQNVTDADVARRLAGEVGLQSDVAATSLVHTYLFQNNESNLEFLRKRAADLGYLLYAQGKKLCFKPPSGSARPIDLRWGESLNEFRPRLTSVSQVNSVTVRGWDPGERREIISQAAKGGGAPEVGMEKKAGDAAQAAFNIEAAHLVSNRPIRSQAAADHLAQAIANRKAESFIEAEGACAGHPSLIAGASVKIDAVGDRFGGVYFVTATRHVYNISQGYQTRFSISGQTPSTLINALRGEDDRPTAAAGLVIGIVTDNQDPLGWGRVKVKYPCLSDEHASDWGRVVSPGAGPGRGVQFLPEVNDEVLVGFEAGDIRYPYIIGGLWNGVDAPPKKNSDLARGGRVQQRVIRSRSGHTIILDDSDSGGVTVEDKNGNKIALNSRDNRLLIEIKGEAKVTSKGGLKLESGAQIEIKGMGVKIDGGAGPVDMNGSVINLN